MKGRVVPVLKILAAPRLQRAALGRLTPAHVHTACRMENAPLTIAPARGCYTRTYHRYQCGLMEGEAALVPLGRGGAWGE